MACHGYGHQMITRLTRAQFAEDVERAKSALEDADRARGDRLSGARRSRWSRETLWSLEVLRGGRLPVRLEHLPDRARPLRHPGRPALPASAERTARGCEHRRVSALHGVRPRAGASRWREAATSGCSRTPSTASGPPTAQPARASAGDRLPAPVGDRSGPAAAAGGLAHPASGTPSTSRTTEAKLRRLLRDFRFAPVRDVLADAGVLAAAESAS